MWESLIVINVLALMGLGYGAGYVMGKGKIEIVRRLNKEEEERLKKEADLLEKQYREDLEAILKGGMNSGV